MPGVTRCCIFQIHQPIHTAIDLTNAPVCQARRRFRTPRRQPPRRGVSSGEA
jgi:hypothetical protein